MTFAQKHPDAEGQGLDFRVSISVELPVPVTQLPSLVQPQLVRIKQRNSYQRSNWRYDLTLVWQGPSRSEAERSQRYAGKTLFEVEIEYCPAEATLKNTSDGSLALNILGKVTSIVNLVHNQHILYNIVA